MTKILILNGAQPYGFAPGGLNATLAGRAKDRLEAQGHDVRLTTVADGYDVEAEVESHRWADTVILQFPINWMGVPWTFKNTWTRSIRRAWTGASARAMAALPRRPKRVMAWAAP